MAGPSKTASSSSIAPPADAARASSRLCTSASSFLRANAWLRRMRSMLSHFSRTSTDAVPVQCATGAFSPLPKRRTTTGWASVRGVVRRAGTSTGSNSTSALSAKAWPSMCTRPVMRSRIETRVGAGARGWVRSRRNGRSDAGGCGESASARPQSVASMGTARSASAAMVSEGLMPSDTGTIEPSSTARPGNSDGAAAAPS
jgi:hypothetical protein